MRFMQHAFRRASRDTAHAASRGALAAPENAPDSEKPASEDAPRDLHLLSPKELAEWDRFAMERRARRLAQTAYLGSGRALCRVLGRYKLFVDTRDVGFASHLMLDGVWEPWVTQFIARTLRPGMTMVDVGANFGYYTVLAADFVGDAGRVVAIEPNPAARAMLEKSVAVNGFAGRVRVCGEAAGGETGEAYLVAPDSEPKNAHVLDEPPPGGAATRVVRRPLDEIVAGEPRIDLVKIDVEGAEEAAVRGMAGVLEKHRPLLVLEFNAARCAAPRRLIRDLSAFYDGPIRRLSPHRGVETVREEDVLNVDGGEDQMLVFATSRDENFYTDNTGGPAGS